MCKHTWYTIYTSVLRYWHMCMQSHTCILHTVLILTHVGTHTHMKHYVHTCHVHTCIYIRKHVYACTHNIHVQIEPHCFYVLARLAYVVSLVVVVVLKRTVYLFNQVMFHKYPIYHISQVIRVKKAKIQSLHEKTINHQAHSKCVPVIW